MSFGPQPIEGLGKKCLENLGLGATEFRERRIILFPGRCHAVHLFYGAEINGPLLTRGSNHFVDGQRLLLGFRHRLCSNIPCTCNSLQFSFRMCKTSWELSFRAKRGISILSSLKNTKIR